VENIGADVASSSMNRRRRLNDAVSRTDRQGLSTQPAVDMDHLAVIQAPACEQSSNRVPTNSSGAPRTRIATFHLEELDKRRVVGRNCLPASLVVLPGAIALTAIRSRPSRRASVVVQSDERELADAVDRDRGNAPPET